MYSRIRVGLVAVVLLGAFAPQATTDELEWLSQTNSTTDSNAQDIPTTAPLRKVGSALAIVLGGFFLVTTLWRRQHPAFPTNAMLEPLGSVQITPKVRLHLVRLGSRILVLHIAGQNVHRVAELDDASEVEQLLAPERTVTSEPTAVTVNELLRSVRDDERGPR